MADGGVDLPDAMEASEIAVSTATVAVTEGGAAGTFDVTLTAAPGGSVDVTVTSSDTGAATVAPTTLTFTDANFDTAQTVTVTPVDDADAGDESVTLTLSATDMTDQTVTVTVTDDDDQGITVGMTAITVVEEATGSTVGVMLDAQPTTDVTVNVASDDTDAATATPATLTFTSANWNVAQDVTITGVADADTADESVTVTVSSTGLTSQTIAVTVTDDDTLNIAATPGTIGLTEGGAASSISVVLTQQPPGAVTVNVASSDSGAVTVGSASLSFDNTNWDTAQTVSVTPVDDDDAQNESATVTLSATGLTSQQVAVTVTDDETQGIVLSANTLALNEGGSGVINVTLAANPLTSVSVNVATSDAGAASVSTTTLSFDATNWSNPHPVTITAEQDDDLAAEAVTVTMSSTGLTSQAVAVSVADDDTQALVVTPTTLPVNEGGMATFTVRLAFQPAGSVTVNMTSGNTGIATVTPSSFAFDDTDWNVAQTATVAGVDDVDLIDESTTVAVTSTGLATVNVSVNVNDDDAQGIVVTPTTLTLTEGGAVQTLNVRLQFDPGGPVTVNVASSDTGAATVSGGPLSFNSGNFSTTQPITVTPVSDPNTANESLNINFTATGISSTTVPVTVNDDDVQALILSANTLSVLEEGTPGTFTVHLAFDPVDPVTVNISSSDTGAATVSPTTLSFNTGNYSTPRTISVAGVSDPDLVDENVTVTVSSAIAPSRTVAVTVTEDDLQNLIVTHAAPFQVTEQIGPQNFTVHLQYQPATTVGVGVASSVTAAATVSSGSLLFTTTNYDTPQSVTVNGVGDPNLHDTASTISVTSPGLTGTSFGVTVFDDDVQNIVVASSVTVNEGGTQIVNLSLAFEPYCHQATPGCSETITITSSDTDAVTASLGSVSFTAANYTTSVPMTISGIEDADILNETETIDLDSNEATTTDEVINVTVLDNDTQNFDFDLGNLVALTEEGATATIGVRLTQDPAGTQNITATSTDSTTVTVAGSPMSFDSGNYTTYQYVTVAAIADVDLLDENVDITFATTGVADSDIEVIANDNDVQGILLHAASSGGSPIADLNVDEEGTNTFYVSLAFQPTNPIDVNLNLAGGETKLSLDTSSITFTGANYTTRVAVVVSGEDDSPEDLNDHLDRIVTATTAPAVNPAAREGASTTLAVDVFDTDAQEILVTLDPESFPISIQEGGPDDNFFVALAVRPRNDVDDVVQVDSPNPAELEVNGGSTDSLTFTSLNWSQPQEVIVTALDDYDDIEAPGSETDDDFDVDLDIPTESSPPNGPGFSPTTVAVHVVDDERLIIQDVTITSMDGATRFTKRQNVNWIETVVGVTAFDAANPGDVVLATAARDDLGSLAPSVTFANATGVPFNDQVQALEFDGTNIGAFSSDGTDGIVYARYTRDLASEVVAPVSVAGSNAVDFWPSWNGTEYGLIFRSNLNGDNNLFFRRVQLNGAASSSTIVTTPTASDHEHPNLHPRSGGGWVVFYTTETAVRCVRLNASGTPIGGSDVALPGVAAGAFVSSAANPFRGTIMLAFNDPTNGLSSAEVNPELCEVLSVRTTNYGSGQVLNTPFIAFNGYEYKVAYDLTTGDVGVTTLGDVGQFLDDVVVGTGSLPSIAWAGDRWVLRSQGSVVMQSGSFQSHCNDGEENLDETGVDCGGSDCVPCVFEFSFTSTSGNDLADDALYNFMLSIQGLVSSTDAVQFHISRGSPLRGRPGSLYDGWCSDGNADWYVDTYIAAWEDGAGTCASPPSADLYYMCSGDGDWTPQGNQSPTSCYNGDWSGGFATWGGSAGTPLAINPDETDGCELEDFDFASCSDGTWTLTLRIGAGGSSTIGEVCSDGSGFTGTGTCNNNN